MNNSEDEKIILTENLKITDVPTGRINWEKFSSFALTFDPRFESLTSDQVTQVSQQAPHSEHDVKTLRAFLYGWQRIQNNKTYAPSSEFLLQAKEVIEWISQKLRNDVIQRG